MDIFKARWKNALRIAAKINRHIKRGDLVIDDSGSIVSTPFKQDNDSIIIEERHGSNIFRQMFFQNHKDWDHGLWTKIGDYNKQFSEWKIVKRENIISAL